MTHTKAKIRITRTSIAPWLTVKNCIRASEFYKSAFGALETYHIETHDGMIVRLAVDEAVFWLSGGYSDGEAKVKPLGGDSVRVILTVSDPDIIFDRALKAGASQIFPIRIDHGWKLGRLVDPFGLHWEIGHPVQ